VQTAAFECVAQSIVHRNITPAQQLLDVIGSHLKPVLVAYFERFGNIAWMKAESRVAFYEVKVNARHEASKILTEKGEREMADGALLFLSDRYAKVVREFAWIKAKKEIEPKSVFDAADEIDKTLTRLLALKKRGAKIDNIEVLDAVIVAYNKASGEQFLKRTTAADTPLDVQREDAKQEMEQEMEQSQQGSNTDSKAATPESLHTTRTEWPNPLLLQKLQQHFDSGAVAAAA
jgi:hypothetical protein